MKKSILNKDFKQILFHSKSLPVRDLLFYYVKGNQSAISFIVSRHKGNAVIRNKFKRRCRALFNIYHANQLKKYQIIVKPTNVIDERYSWNNLKRSFDDFCSKLKT